LEEHAASRSETATAAGYTLHLARRGKGFRLNYIEISS
jgi:hypothetical protein